MQFSNNYDNWKTDSINMMRTLESMRYEHLWAITINKTQIALESEREPPVHSAPYRTGAKQRDLEKESIAQMDNASVAKVAVAE